MKSKSFLLWFAFLSLIAIIGFTGYYIFNNNSCLVSFNSNGGTKIYDINVKINNTLAALPTPSKSGYEFQGWYLGDTLFDVSKPITKNITLIAKWNKAIITTYKVSFDTLGGEKIDDIIVEAGAIITEVPNPTKNTYLFKSWQYQNKEFEFNTPINSNIILVAKYEKEMD